MNVAMPFTSVAWAREVSASLNETLPVGSIPVTDAVKVTGESTVVGFTEVLSVTCEATGVDDIKGVADISTEGPEIPFASTAFTMK